MKSKHIGLILLVVVIIIVGVFIFMQSNQKEQVTLNGFLGGEKIGLFEDDEFKKYLQKEHGLTLNYSKAGSLEMVETSHENRDYLFPSSQTALNLYENLYGKAPSSEIIFNTPIVLYTRKPVLEGLINNKVVTEEDGVYYADMVKLASLIEKKTAWSALGVNLYGNVKVHMTNPTMSNSGNMFAGLMANALNNGQVVDESVIDEILPRLRSIVSDLGFMETSSSDLWNQFLTTGLGSKPMIAGYENQILEFAYKYPEEYASVKDDLVILYPTPTVWSSHVYIALNDKAKSAIMALKSPEVLKIAWEHHGFRTGVAGGTADVTKFGVNGIPKEVNQIIPMPNANMMKKILDFLR